MKKSIALPFILVGLAGCSSQPVINNLDNAPLRGCAEFAVESVELVVRKDDIIERRIDLECSRPGDLISNTPESENQ